MSTPKHLLRWKGRQAGPFGLEEIRARLQTSEIGLMHEVQVQGAWMTVEQFLSRSTPIPGPSSAPRPEPRTPAAAAPLPPHREELRLPPEPAPPLPTNPTTAAAPAAPPLPKVPPTPPPIVAPAGPPEAASPQAGAAESWLAYGGFWLRVAATFIDAAIVSAVLWSFAAILLVVSRETPTALPGWLETLIAGLYLGGGWLYHSLLESSPTQATLGKMAVGLVVTDRHGAPLSFAQASGRYGGKILSVLTLGVGFFMAAFTPRKQALHDLLAGCHVLLRLPAERFFEP